MTPAFTFAKAIAGQSARERPGSAAPIGARVRSRAKKRKRDDSFRGPRCSAGWMALESEDARRLRGHGIFEFNSLIRRQRNNKCPCGRTTRLKLYHLMPPTTHRELRFERSNVKLLCVACVGRYRRNEVAVRSLVTRKTSFGEARGLREDDLDSPREEVSSRVLYHRAKSRWEIENQGFNDAKNRHDLGHMCHHHPNSLLIVWLLTSLALTIEGLYRLRYLRRGTHPVRTAMEFVHLLWLSLSRPTRADSS
jgi:hypothetical protein